jgi:solute carrier family 35 protein F5
MRQIKRRRYALGLLCLGCVVVLWVGSSVLIQAIFHDLKYDKPFALTFLNTSLFAFYLPINLVTKWWQRRQVARRGVRLDSNASNGSSDGLAPPRADEPPRGEEAELLQSAGAQPQFPLFTLKQTMQLSGILCPLWFLMNYLFNLSLDYTSNSSNTILS